MSVLKEHERVVLTTSVGELQLEAGDVGTIVHVYTDGTAYEVEFVTLDGHTTAVATLERGRTPGYVEGHDAFSGDRRDPRLVATVAEKRDRTAFSSPRFALT